MGFFTGMKSNLRKAEASVVIQNLLERQERLGLLPKGSGTPAALANKLVEITWDRNPVIKDSSPPPHKLALAAASLSMGAIAMDKASNSEARASLAICLGSVLMEIAAISNQLKLSPIDLHLIEQAEGVYMRFPDPENSPIKL